MSSSWTICPDWIAFPCCLCAVICVAISSAWERFTVSGLVKTFWVFVLRLVASVTRLCRNVIVTWGFGRQQPRAESSEWAYTWGLDPRVLRRAAI